VTGVRRAANPSLRCSVCLFAVASVPLGLLSCSGGEEQENPTVFDGDPKSNLTRVKQKKSGRHTTDTLT